MLLHEIKSMYLFETEKLKSSSVYVFDKSQSIVQGQSWQTVFFKLALRDRNMQVRFFWKVFLKSWDLRNFASATSFHEIYTVCHLRSNLQTCKKNWGKKILNVTIVKLLIKDTIQCFSGFLMPSKKSNLHISISQS